MDLTQRPPADGRQAIVGLFDRADKEAMHLKAPIGASRLPASKRCVQKRTAAFTLTEMLIASGIVALLVLANMATICSTRIMETKDADGGVVSGFMQHYAELVKAMPFDQVMTNRNLSGLYSGADNTPQITLPPGGNWFSISSTSYQLFHPSLLAITNRQPQMRVIIETTYDGAMAHDKHISVECQWDPPLLAGARQYRRLDLFRVRDL
jgi:hypothetical protein